MDLFDTAKPAKNTSYTAKDIEVLEGLEPVRKRPGMYIGGTDNHALHHLAVEVIDNSMDEAVAGYAKEIGVTLLDERTITITDNGRGIPVDPHPKYPEKSALEVILTTLHSGGKFSNKSYSTAGGLHGVGVSVVNALSEHLEVKVFRDGTAYTQTYSKGHATSGLSTEPAGPRKKGTAITFTPDATIFGVKNTFNAATVYNLLKAKAYLYKGVKIVWQTAPAFIKGDKTPEKEVICYPNGLLDYLGSLTATESLHAHFADDIKLDNGRLEWAIGWGEGLDSKLLSFCNTIHTPQGGTHENAFKQAVTKSFRSFGERINEKKATQIMADDIFENVVAVISAFIPEPQFQGQTKEKLLNKEVSRPIEVKLQDYLDHWLVTHKDMAEQLLQLAIQNMEYRLKRRQQKDIQRSSAAKRVPLPGKLVDCSQQNREGTELFLVEGDSASGSAKQARNRKTQAILPLRGKILNVATATDTKALANQEVQNITQALGGGVGEAFDAAKLRYDRVIIMTDADVDGAHISSLLMTFFFTKMRALITGGHLYLAQPPLYKLTAGGKTVYAQDDEERKQLLDTTFKKYTHVEVSRFKGLGEMMPAQLKETTMDPARRTLLKVLLTDEALDDTTGFIENLMGKKVEPRFKFIQENAQFAEELDV